MRSGTDDDLDRLLAEQSSYYRARAHEYFDDAMDLSPDTLTAARRELVAAIAQFRPSGHVLELACGPGTWTSVLLRYADTVTAIDGSSEMLALARRSVPEERVTFVEDDLFEWAPEQRYDAVFFGFWLSHVPLERFERFWWRVADALVPRGRVMFIDDAYRTPEELVEGEDSSTVERRLTDGTAFRIVKVPHTPRGLEERLSGLGWRIEVRTTSGPFFWGSGGRRT